MTATLQPTKPESVLRPRLAVTALFLANGNAIGLWAASIAPIKLGFGLSNFELSMVLLAFAVGAILTMTVTGHIQARFGSARVSPSRRYARPAAGASAELPNRDLCRIVPQA